MAEIRRSEWASISQHTFNLLIGEFASLQSWALGTMPEFILGIGEGHKWHASFVRLAGKIFIAWISVQSEALAQSAYDVEALNKQVGEFNNRGKYAETLALAKQAPALADNVLRSEHATTLSNINNLAALHAALGRYDEAEPIFKRPLTGAFEKQHGPEIDFSAAAEFEVEV